MATALTCGQCPQYQTERKTGMTPYGQHSCAKGFTWTYYAPDHPCHRLENQPMPTNRPAPKPPRGQIGLIGD